MDWQPGEFLDRDLEFIICSTHGATYEPLTGRCAGGPCVGIVVWPAGFRSARRRSKRVLQEYSPC